MAIKKYRHAFSLFAAIFILNISVTYASVSFDELDSMLEDDIIIQPETEKPVTVIKGKDAETLEKKAEKSSERIKRLAAALEEEPTVNSSDYSVKLIIILSAFGAFIFIVLYFFFYRIKGLTDQARASTDLSEKYFYDIQQGNSMNCEKSSGVKAELSKHDNKINISMSLTSSEIDNILYSTVDDIVQKVMNGNEITRVLENKNI